MWLKSLHHLWQVLILIFRSHPSFVTYTVQVSWSNVLCSCMSAEFYKNSNVLARCSSWNWKIVINLLNANAIVSQKNSKTFNQRHFRSIGNSINCSWEMELWQGFVYWSWNKRLFWCKPLCLSDVGWLFKCEKWWSFIVFLSMKQRVVNVSGIIINYTSH